MTVRIPEPPGPSGTFAALERHQPDELFAFCREDARLRGLIIDGNPWFVTADALAILDLSRSSSALLDDDEKGVHTVDTPGGQQTVGVISEAGLYSLVLRSRKPEAKAIKRWITHEVLPSIRKTGSYSRFPAHPAATLPSKRELAQWVIEFEDRALAAEARAAELETPAAAWEQLAVIGGDYEVADAAKILSRDPAIQIGRDRLFAFMNEQDWIFRGRHNRWKAYQEQVECGRLKHRPGGKYFHPDSGEYRTGDPSVLVTAKGIAELRRLLGGAPYVQPAGTQLSIV